MVSKAKDARNPHTVVVAIGGPDLIGAVCVKVELRPAPESTVNATLLATRPRRFPPCARARPLRSALRSSWGALKPFRETLARICDEGKKFALGDPHDVDVLMRRLASHLVCDIFAGDEQRARELLLMTLCVLQQTSEVSTRRFGGAYRNELRIENETTRRIHQRDAVEVSITLGSHSRAVEAKCDPGFVDLKLLRVEHKKIVPMTPDKITRAREAA